jgi:hypothetical protein
MDQPIVQFAVYALLGIVIYKVVHLAIARGDFARTVLAYRVHMRTLLSPAFGEKVRALLEPAEPKPAKPSGEPLRLLAVLQRDSRFLDFFMENIQTIEDDRIISFVKKMHPECQTSLKDHLTLEPVMSQFEGDNVEVAAGFDPSAIRLLGNVTGQPPFRGTLQHRGWRVKELKLAAPPAGQDEFVVQPAEVVLP